MKAALSRLLIEAAKADPKVMVLTGDHGYGLFKDFRRECPGQFLNCGIAEQNMIGVAAGLARQGFKPIVYALAAFMPCRVVEQIKLDLCYPNLPVILIGDGAGLVYSYLGPSHHACEDVALLRSLPNITILSPADRHELAASFDVALSGTGPTYIRVGKSDRGDVHPGPVRFTPGSVLPVLDLRDPWYALVASGSMVRTALDVAAILPGGSRPHDVAVFSVPTLKPLTQASLTRIDEARVVVTLEEHSAFGGLGSAIAELFEDEPGSTSLLRLGVPDAFRHTAGTWEYQMRECGLDTESIVRRIQEALGE